MDGALTSQQAAAEIYRLINGSPRAPRPAEIERIIGRVHLNMTLGASVAELDAGKDRAEYLGLIGEMRPFCKRTEGSTVEEEVQDEPILNGLQEAVTAYERERIWKKPAQSWSDVLLYAEAALYNENGIMVNLGRDDVYTDDRAIAELINAVITVGRRFFGQEDNGEREGDV